MTSSDQLSSELFRVRVVLAAMLAALAFLAASLWRVQVVDVSKYRTSLDRQSVRSVRLPGIRGAILDRNGVCLARNRPSYCMAIYIEELRQRGGWNNTANEVEKTIMKLSEALGLKPEVTLKDIKKHISRRLALPLLAWRDLDQAALARWAENCASFPGVDVYIEPVREYPMGTFAAHALGYVGKKDDPKREWGSEEEEAEEPYDYYLPQMEGKFGVERALNDELSGIAGGYLIRVDASGFKHSEINEEERGRRDPASGSDIALTLDSRVQKLVENALENAFRGESNATLKGAAIVLDPRNGDILAMASAPAFDPNIFSPAAPLSELKKLQSDPANPFLNRAVSGRYPPGSTFKPFVAIAALETGRATGGTSFNCPGYFELGDTRFHCWQKAGHGFLPMRKAIEQSCNAYFCQLGLACGYDRLYRMADAIGFGHKTGLMLGEQAGLLPSKKRGWSAGDTCNVSIGQGALLVTPLQMAVSTAALANGGYVYRPRLLLKHGDSRGEIVAKMGWSQESLRQVVGGMRDVIEGETGTGKRAKIAGVEMAGKTGTAEFNSKDGKKKYTWMTVFAPFGAPRYVAALVIEEGVSGGVTVAPCVRELMSGIFAAESGAAAKRQNQGISGEEREQLL